MALVTRDSFDLYTANTDGASGNLWGTFSPDHLDSVITRFGFGKSFSMGNLAKGIGSNQGTLFFAFAGFYNAAFSGTGFLFAVSGQDSGNFQCTVAFYDSGTIKVFSGGEFGTQVASFSSAWPAQTWFQIQIKIVINNSTGEVHIRLNGNTSDDFVATGINTRGGTSNNYATDMKLGGGQFSGPNNNVFVDDVIFYTGAAGTPWDDWVGDVRSVISRPSGAGSTTDFANSGSPVADFLGRGTSGGTFFASSNTQETLVPKWNAARDGTIGSCDVHFASSGTGNVIIGIFDDSGAGGSPGALLATSNVVNNPTSGSNIFTFGSPLAITHGTNYWFCFLADFGPQFDQQSGFGTSFPGFTQSRSYGSGFANPMSGSVDTSHAPVNMFASVTVSANYQYVQDLAQDGATSYVADSTVNDNDLYAMDDISTSFTILGVSVRSFVQKSDGGSRSGAVQLKSGSTTVDSGGSALPTSWGNLVFFQDTDPDTSSAWTVSGVNAAQAGPKVTA